MTVYLTANEVYKSYGTTRVLKGVSLDLFEGEILALLGPNGSGKTTFIKILATLLTKDAGDVEILGYNLDRDVDAIRHLFGYVGQDTERSAYARLTVRENLHFFGTLHGLSRKQIERQINKLAGYFDFEANINKLFHHLSGGQKQTVVIMRALLYDPPIVYLDEPTKGLDPFVAQKIRTYLKAYAREERKALLLTSHILSEVDELANRVALINDGTISVVATPARLKQDVGVPYFIDIQKDAITPAIKEEILAHEAIVLCREREEEWWSFGVANVLDGTEGIIRVLRKHQLQTHFRNHAISLEDAFVHHIGMLKDSFDR
jgi:ABC-2 type transport system ATP-binding protein